ncbi:MAG: alpha/beta hydrolase [Candidatus Dadabacteria bacterium]|nr:alpha/beta hydrolase [Candidatus Dadabacteria bacterium]NIS08802.1 alpha/beta hydrolase [Candidatus Dadabacteria bacterium]NIY22152.1 alpha/beta fold hydrolase [Candidatus Dadabacteria bacterium]
MNISHKKLVTFKAKDGFEINAVLTICKKRSEKELYNTPIIIQVHGVLGNFLTRGTPRLLPPALFDVGIHSLSINSRMAHMGQIIDSAIFDETIYDIDAAVKYLVKLGYHRIYIIGYSLGANITAYYASVNKHRNVKGVILEGCSYSLPESQKERLGKCDSIPSYDDIYEKAKHLLLPDPLKSENDRIFVVYRAWGPTFNPIDCEMFSYKTWWFMRSPQAENAKTYKLIDKIKLPVLFINGKNDDIVYAWEPKDLKKILNRSGNKNVLLRFIPNAKHDCMENPKATISAIKGFIKKMQ